MSNLPMLLLLTTACTQDAGKGVDTSAAAIDSGAGEDASGITPIDVNAVVSEEVHTVVTVSWTTPEETTGWVEFGEDDGYGRTTPIAASGTSHVLQLRGLWADTTFHFRVVAEAEDGTRVETGDHTVTTGSLPAEIPTVTVSGDVQSWIGQYQVVPLQGTTYTVVVLDDHARVVWYRVLEAEGNLMRAMMTADRSGFLFCLAGSGPSLPEGVIRRVSYDGYTEVDVPFPNVDHDFTELPDGTFAGIVVTPGPNGQAGNADRIVELAPDGTGERTIWNAWEDEHLAAFQSEASQNWTHANGLDYDPAEDVYYLSLKEIGTVVKVDRATGTGLWYLDGRANEFAFAEGSEMPMMQHQFQRLGDSMLLFDNGTPDRGYSRAVELRLDEDARLAEQTWEYIRDPSVYVFAKGDVHRFADGNTQVVWSASGEIQNVSPAGEVHWQLNTELGYAITFVQLVEDLYGGS